MVQSQHIYISVNSQDRNSGGSPNKYTVNLPRLIRNVTMIELINAEIPNSLYPDTVRYLYFGLGTGTQMLICQTTIPVGVWTHQNAAQQMTANIGVITIMAEDATTKDVPTVNPLEIEALEEGEPPPPVAFDTIEDGRLVYITTDNFHDVTDPEYDPLQFIGNNPGTNAAMTSTYAGNLNQVSFQFDPRLGKFFVQFPSGLFDTFKVFMKQTDTDMGFTNHWYPLQPNGTNDTYYANSIAQLWVTSHIWMTIDELANMPYSNLVSTNSLPMNLFARIQMATDIMHWVFWSQGFEEYKRECAPGQTTTLRTLTVGWLDDNGLPVDFHGLNHSLMFRVTQSPPD